MVPELKGFGLNVDINHFDDESTSKIIEYLKNLKVRWVRTEIDFFKYQDKEKIQHLHKFFKLCNKEGITVVGLLSQFVSGNLDSVLFSYKYHKHILSYIEDYSDFVETVVKLFDNEIFYWEIWNEENSRRFWIGRPSPEEYVSFLSIISKIIRQANSENKIIFGGIVGNDVTPLIPLPKSSIWYKGYIEEAMKHGANEYVDYFAFHPYILDCYFSFRNREKILEIIKSRITETKNKYSKDKLIISEFGISLTASFSLKDSDVAYIYKELLKFTEELNIPICIYGLIDLDETQFEKANPEKGFGLLDSSLQPKKLYNALVNYL